MTKKRGKETAVQHVIRRALERYGLALRRIDVRQLERDIAGGKSVRVRIEKDNAERHIVSFNGVTMLAIWNPVRHLLCTVLPPEATTYRKYTDGKRQAMKADRRRKREEQDDANVY